ncbi:MAG: mucin desulfatase, partial [Lachnospiraceae bacterium]|nr:mucin desulfatase [Lachnospiraceae bacterium]
MIREVLDAFDFGGIPVSSEGYGSGHINDTYLVKVKKADGSEGRVILQHMNSNVFKEPELLMENV